MEPLFFVTLYQFSWFSERVSTGLPDTSTSITVVFSDDQEWVFSDCSGVESLTNPDRFVFHGSLSGRVAEWVFPATSVLAIRVSKIERNKSTSAWTLPGRVKR